MRLSGIIVQLVLGVALQALRGNTCFSQAASCTTPAAFTITDALSRPTCIQELNLRNQSLELLPPSVGQLPRLRRPLLKKLRPLKPRSLSKPRLPKPLRPPANKLAPLPNGASPCGEPHSYFQEI